MANRPINKFQVITGLVIAGVMFTAGLLAGSLILAPKVAFPPSPLPDSTLPTPALSWENKASLPGNSFATAFNLIPGYDTSGSLSSQNVEDFYTFTTDHTAKVQITGTNTPQDYRWYLYDSNFQLIASTIRSGVVEGRSTVVLQKPGRYYLRIIGKYGSANNLPYVIRLDISPFFS